MPLALRIVAHTGEMLDAQSSAQPVCPIERRRSDIPTTDDPWAPYILGTPVIICNLCTQFAGRKYDNLSRLDNSRDHCYDPTLAAAIAKEQHVAT